MSLPLQCVSCVTHYINNVKPLQTLLIMKKIVIFLAMLMLFLLALAGGGNGLLWRVSGNGLPSSSYILGSHHMAPASFVDSIAGLDRVLDEVDRVTAEVKAGELTSIETQQKMMALAVAPADSTLSRVLTPGQLVRLDSLLALYTGMPGLTAQMEMLKPAMVSTQIAVLQTAAACPEAQAATPFDAVVMAAGTSRGKSIEGLETIDEQLALLFNTPISIQASDLMDAVADNDKLTLQARMLMDAYLSQDLDAVTEVVTNPEFGTDPADLDRLIYSRNRAWAERLDSMLADGASLVVVGCGHLGGEQGLLNLLRKKGYEVTPINR